MKAKSAKSISINDASRCQHRTANGRCRMPAVDSAANLCFDHARRALQARQNSDFAHYLTRDSAGFQTAQGINHSLADLYTLLAQGHISPRRASVLAYVASLLLRSLPAIDKDPVPEADRPINWIDAPNHETSTDASPSEAAADADISPDAAEPCSGRSLDRPAQPPPPSTARSSEQPDESSPSRANSPVGPASKPLPATAQEFAAQILNRKPN
ncbi:MAG TPA: hypothetical protein VIH67_11720 [Candidatus Acidoferrum sp.]